MSERFSKYIPAGEPVITVNVVAAILLAAAVGALNAAGVEVKPGGDQEELLYILGLVAFAVATWLSRASVFSPRTHEAEVQVALHAQAPPGDGA